MTDDIKRDDPEYAKDRAGVSDDDLHTEMLARHSDCRDYWRSQYDLARSDMEFAFTPESQWDEWMTSTRKGRPMYSVNKVRQAMKQITNDQRQNRPQAKVRAEEEDDNDLAEVRQGLIRNIDSKLDAQRAVDTAFQFAVGGGFGVWRLTTSYQEDGGFDLVIQREEVSNPYSVVFDPSAKKKDRRDAEYAFVDSQYSRAAFTAKWPKAKLISVADTLESSKDWWFEDDVVVAEYWYKKATKVEIVLMSDGSVYDVDEKYAAIADEMAMAGITEQRRRVVERAKVWQCIVSGDEILEGPTEWAGSYIPLVPVWGEILNLKDRDIFFGAVRFAKDAQRMYNYERSTFIEVLADQPYSPFMADAASIEGYEAQYQGMRTQKPPVLLFNGDPLKPNGGMPMRQDPPAFPAALAQAAQISADDIKASTGIYDASLGARSNETSGKAIIARQRIGDVANFDYVDNLAYALKYDFEVMNDLITKTYDTERQVRIIGEDGSEKVVAVNEAVIDQQTQQQITLNDLSQGRYDVSVTVGPSYNTQRMEAAEAMMQLANDPSPIGMVAKYGFIKNLDSPGLEDVRKAARKILVQQGLLEPEQDEQPPEPPQPNPKDVADAKKAEADAARSAAQAGLYGAQTEQTSLESMEMATRMGVQMGAMGIAPPMPEPPPMQGQPMPMQPNQPPQGGFSLPGIPGQPPQGTAPDGFPGLPS